MADDPLIVSLHDAEAASLVGGKALSLGRLIRAGLPVPDGFVVTTAAWASAGGSGDVPAEVLDAARETYRAMGAPVVAVRSSGVAEDAAGASMAGLYETVLGVQGEQALADAIAHCWASASADRVQTYLGQQGTAADAAALAVVVQRLVPADVAGVLFTSNPQAADGDEMLLEASWGLGESVVSGNVQPDTFVLDRATGRVREARIATKSTRVAADGSEQAVADEQQDLPCLTSAQIHQLYHLGQQVRDYYGSAQDIEWAFVGETLWLLQSRPITTLEEAEKRMVVLHELRDRLRRATSAGKGPWVRHNIGETLPHPTPLTWSLIGPFMTGRGGWGEMHRQVGYEPSETACDEGFLDLLGGGIYMDMTRATEMFFEGFPFAYDPNYIAENPSAAQEAPTVPVGTLGQRRRAAGKLQAVDARLHELQATCDDHLNNDVLPALLAYVAQQQAIDLDALPVNEWCELWRQRRETILGDFGAELFLPSMVYASAREDLKQFLATWVWDEPADALTDAVIVGEQPDGTLLSNEGLHRVGTGERSLEDWLEEFGHRGPGEFDLASPRWADQPDEAAAMAKRLANARSPLETHTQRRRQAEQRLGEIRQAIPAGRREELTRLWSTACRYSRWREDGKGKLMLGWHLLRDMALSAARRLGLPAKDIFLLSEEELIDAMNVGIVPLHLIELRREHRGVERNLDLPEVILPEDIDEMGTPQVAADGESMDGFAVSTGVRTGPARIVREVSEAGDLGEDYVLVAPSTDPNWTPLFVKACGLVLERGGALSHGAVVAREMGLPAVVLPGATTLLTEGEAVTIDGQGGRVVRGRVEPESVETPVEDLLPPPPPGPAERKTSWILFGGLVVWTAVLLVMFLAPPNVLHDPLLRLGDEIFWPLVPWIGRVGAAVVVGVGIGVVIALAQWAIADVKRLRVAQKRMKAIQKHMRTLPADDPKRAELQARTAGVQWRVVAGSLAALVLLLGPMIWSFLWVMMRLPRGVANAPAGGIVNVVATVDGEWLEPVSIQPPPGFVLGESTPVVRSLPPIRATLEDLLMQWQKRTDLSGLPWDAQAAAIKARKGMLASLRSYLGESIPPQTLRWEMDSPEQSGEYHVTVRTGDEAVTMPIRLGDAVPPGAPVALAELPGHIRKVEVVRKVDPSVKPFWRPLRWMGIGWDFGWLGAYLVAYLPGFFLLRRVLRLP
ncbi:MAG: hypothetical protein GVY16_11180 [Planctomycetes bacterium]|jgi:pyruvate,water dikinase|nr:hypothetical protein [Phycisphaerae bacterium]NBB96286.1 hypothetical protein [Planctomycetota bacterium]